MSRIFREPSFGARAEAVRIMEAIADRRAPGRLGGAVLAALLHQRQLGIKLDEGAWRRMKRAIARLCQQELDSSPLGLDDAGRCRVLITDAAIQRIAVLRIKDLDTGRPIGLLAHRADPDVRYLGELRQFSSISSLRDRKSLSVLADGRFEDLPRSMMAEIYRQLERSRQPLTGPLEDSIQRLSKNCANAVMAQGLGFASAQEEQSRAKATREAYPTGKCQVSRAFAVALGSEFKVASGCSTSAKARPSENVLEGLSQGSSLVREEYERMRAGSITWSKPGLDVRC